MRVNKACNLEGMKTRLFVMLLLLIVAVSGDCTYRLGDNYFKLDGLEKPANGDAYSAKYTYGTTQYTLAFNLCGFTPNKAKCNGAQDFGTVTYSDTCKSLSSNSLKNVEAVYYKSGNHTAGVSLTFAPGDVCPHSDAEFYTLSVAVVCDQDREETEFVRIDPDSLITPCSPRALLYSAKGCPTLKVNALFQWLELVRYGAAAVAGLLGIYFMIFGFKLYKLTCFLIGMAATPVLVVGNLYALVIPHDSKTWIVTIPVGLAILFGIGVGILTMKKPIFARILAGLFGMFAIHTIIYIFITHWIRDETAATLIFWCGVLVSTVIGAILGSLYFPAMFIVGTAYAGSYLLYRCLSVFTKGFTNEFVIVRERVEGRYTYIPWSNFIIAIFILLTGAFAVITQYWFNQLDIYEKKDEGMRRLDQEEEDRRIDYN